jgi:lipopolysaccharide transport system ATP-binding protein
MSSNHPAIRVSHLSKQYKLGGPQEPYHTLRDAIVNSLKAPIKIFHKAPPVEGFWALKDVSFEVEPGEVVGIIGRNGAGKSTLLKILSRITSPTEGTVELHGRVGSLLEVGTGFHPELTGRENIYLSGSILGMKRREIDARLDDIVKFSEIEQFLDTPVKRYSSGMYVRLAFAVAAHMDTEIMLVDEVLAVGDAQFQKKCMGKMEDVSKGEGKTVLFVSHNSNAITSLCNRALWVNEGKITEDGEAKKVVGDYLGQIQKGFEFGQVSGKEKIIIKKILLKNQKGEKTNNFLFGEDLILELFFYAPEKIIKPKFWIAVGSQFGSLFGANMLLDDCSPEYIEKEGRIICIFHKLPLLAQQYTISLGIRDEYGRDNLIKTREAGFFNVIGSMKDIGFHGHLADALCGSSTPVVLSYEWQFPKNEMIVEKPNEKHNTGD